MSCVFFLYFQPLALKYFIQIHVPIIQGIFFNYKYRFHYWQFSNTQVNFEKDYLVKMGPSFIGSHSFYFIIYQIILRKTSLLGKRSFGSWWFDLSIQQPRAVLISQTTMFWIPKFGTLQLVLSQLSMQMGPIITVKTERGKANNHYLLV